MANLEPFPLRGYSDFATVKSGANGTVKGELPLESDSDAFVYAKELLITVPLGLDGQRTLQGKWKIQILDSPDGAVIFEQTITWRATIVSLNIGGIFLITWSPAPITVETMTYPPGAGYPETTIIDGGAIEAGTAWQYIDTPNPTEFSEQGYTLFEPEGTAAIGDVSFFATWVSPPYLCRILPGAVLKRVSDGWGFGTINTNATYSFSFRSGSSLNSATWNAFGGIVTATSNSAGVATGAIYTPFGARQGRGHIAGAALGSIMVDKFGRPLALAREGDGWFLSQSQTGGRTWKPILDAENKRRAVWAKEIRMARATMDDSQIISAAMDGNKAVVKRISRERDITTIAGVLEKKQDLTPLVKGGKIFVIGSDGVAFVSRDGGATWRDR